jgi:epoxyqueuosine reductase QueG
MDRERLLQIAADFCEGSPTNFLRLRGEGDADSAKTNNFARYNLYGAPSDANLLGAVAGSGYEGMRFFKNPAMSIGSASDPGFETIREDGVVGKYHKLPGDWLEGAKSVISFFLPFETRVVESNKSDPVEPSMEWLFTRVDGQQHLLAFGAHIRDAFEAEGYRAVAPQLEDAYVMRPGLMPMPGGDTIPPYASNWSERHVGYVTGLGTFGLSTNFISKVGCAGRMMSVVTDWEVAPDTKDYATVLGYCSECGACIRKCPAKAYTATGKDHAVCGEHIHETCKKYEPRYGCGKCQSGIPCESKPQIKR